MKIIYGSTEQHLGQPVNEDRSIVVTDKFSVDAILRYVEIEHADMFGKYEITLLHDLASRDIEILAIKFERSKRTDEKET